MEDMKDGIVFMGSPDFALPTLAALHEHFNVVGVVTQPDRPAGRGRTPRPPDVKRKAQELDLPVIQPESLKSPEALAQLEAWSPDVIVVAAYGQILRESVLTLPPFGCVNVHASLLPRWRGAAPIQAAILHDDKTGVTIMKMDKGLDTGPILSQREVPISLDMTGGRLFDVLATEGAALLIDTLPRYLAGDITPRPQDDSLSTYAPMLKKADGKLDFSKPAKTLARQVRAYHPWPGAFQFFEGKRLKIYQAHAVSKPSTVPGERTIVDDKPAWGTAEGVLVLDRLQMSGRQVVSGEAFLHGVRDWINSGEEE